jgi:hypothetical protein
MMMIIIIIIIIYKIIKVAYLIDVSVPSSHNRNSTITENMRNYTDLKVELLMLWLVKTTYRLRKTTSSYYPQTVLLQTNYTTA